MISICAAIVVASLNSQDDDAITRVERFFKSQPNLKATMDIELPQNTKVKQTYWLIRPNLQRIIVEVGGGQYEMRQGPEGVIGYNNLDRTYSIQPPAPIPVNVLQDAPFAAIISFPIPIAAGTLKTPGAHNWEEVPTRAGAWKTLKSESTSNLGVTAIFADVASDGRILNFGGTIVFGTSIIEVHWKNIQYETIAGIDRRVFEQELPEGYTPAYIPRRQYGLGAGDPMPQSQWRDAATGKPVDPMSLAGKNGLGVLFSAPDCEISRKNRAAFADVEKALKAVGANLIEVSIGSEKPAESPKWRQIWDKEGAIADLLMIDATPHLVLFDKDGVCAGYFPGYTEASKPTLMQQIKDALGDGEE